MTSDPKNAIVPADPALSELERADRLSAETAPLQMDEETFRVFYARTSRVIWGYLRRIAGDAALADDLLQETYYRFLRAGGQADSDLHRRRYLFRIATNVVNDRFRRTRVRPVEVHHDVDTMAGTSGHGALDRRLDVNKALSSLRRRERAMLWLAYMQGASHEEIAGVLGLRTSSVKPLLFRARQRLARRLGRRKEGV